MEVKPVYFLLLLCFSLQTCQVRDTRIAGALDTITEKSLKAHVEALTQIGPRHHDIPESLKASIEYLESKLRSYGYDPLVESFYYGNVQLNNLFVTIPGNANPDTIVEVGAHYDTVRVGPGADDNASGVAGLLEVARVLAEFETEKTIRLCFFAGEEEGLQGSSAHVKNILSRGEQVEGLISLEMIGYTTDEPNSQKAPIRIPLVASLPYEGDFILVVGNFDSGSLGNQFERAIDLYVPELRYCSFNRIGGFFGDAARSDHSPYWESEMHGVMITDTANFRNPHYHKKTDRIATLNLEFAKRVARAATAACLDWAEVMFPED